MSKQVSKEEALQMFIEQVEFICDYWINETRAETNKDKVEGAVFSIMNIFDGSCGGFPAAVDLVLRPHPDDKEYCIKNDEPWVLDGMVINDDCHLHELLFKELATNDKSIGFSEEPIEKKLVSDKESKFTDFDNGLLTYTGASEFNHGDSFSIGMIKNTEGTNNISINKIKVTTPMINKPWRDLAYDETPEVGDRGYNYYKEEYEYVVEGQTDFLGLILIQRPYTDPELGDLLAVIHRDGGQYQANHGTEKTIEDAKQIFFKYRDDPRLSDDPFCDDCIVPPL